MANKHKQKSFLGYAAMFLVFIPLVLVAAGYALASVMPGCVMLGENGAHGCYVANYDFNQLFEFIGSWGQIWLVVGIGSFICVLLPAWIIVVTWKDFRS